MPNVKGQWRKNVQLNYSSEFLHKKILIFNREKIN